MTGSGPVPEEPTEEPDSLSPVSIGPAMREEEQQHRVNSPSEPQTEETGDGGRRGPGPSCQSQEEPWSQVTRRPDLHS